MKTPNTPQHKESGSTFEQVSKLRLSIALLLPLLIAVPAEAKDCEEFKKLGEQAEEVLKTLGDPKFKLPEGRFANEDICNMLGEMDKVTKAIPVLSEKCRNLKPDKKPRDSEAYDVELDFQCDNIDRAVEGVQDSQRGVEELCNQLAGVKKEMHKRKTGKKVRARMDSEFKMMINLLFSDWMDSIRDIRRDFAMVVHILTKYVD